MLTENSSTTVRHVTGLTTGDAAYRVLELDFPEWQGTRCVASPGLWVVHLNVKGVSAFQCRTFGRIYAESGDIILTGCSSSIRHRCLPLFMHPSHLDCPNFLVSSVRPRDEGAAYSPDESVYTHSIEISGLTGLHLETSFFKFVVANSDYLRALTATISGEEDGAK